MTDYVSRHRREWQELEGLVKRARRSVTRLTPTELNRLDVLYRKTAVQLAQVGTRTRDMGLIRYLNDLTAAAHSIVYLPPRGASGRRVGCFLATGFARAVARTLPYHAVSALLLVLGGCLAYLAVRQDPVAAYALLPAGEFRQPGMTSEQLSRILGHGRDMPRGVKFVFASFLFGHNLKVGLLALATGVLAGLPTIILLVYNGMVLGALTSVYHLSGIHAAYWAWILPHGVTELTAIVLCGGAGLLLGRVVLAPGLRTREESLRLAGREVARICLGVAGMLLFAAVVESYLRQSHLPTWARFAFAGATFVFWAAYFTRGVMAERAAARGADRRGLPAGAGHVGARTRAAPAAVSQVERASPLASRAE
jgi:uncharacterized membrane protein SpoIIM required for sporulation